LPDAVIAHCTRRAFSAMIDLARAEDVAFVVIAGDLYDGDWKDFSTGLFFAREMQRFGRPCFLLRGNHDAVSIITRDLTPPPNVREFSSRTCQTFRLDEAGVALHGHSFPNRAVPEDLSASYSAPVSGLLNIGVLHTSAEDRGGEHATYAPCSVANLRLKGYDYWALGHIHIRQVLSERPWIVFPGNIQGRNPRETGAKGCTLVTVEDRRIVAVEHRLLDVLRWVAADIDVTGADVSSVPGLLAERARAAVAEGDGLPVLARVTVRGATALHGRLLADTDQLAAEFHNGAIEAGGTLFVESLRVRTRPVAMPEDDMLAPLRAAFMAGMDDPALVRGLLEHLAEVRQKMPAAGREGLDWPGDPVRLAELSAEAWQIVAEALGPVGTV
jgi:DNA repair exonuclease SbcCD nuclease subunit